MKKIVGAVFEIGLELSRRAMHGTRQYAEYYLRMRAVDIERSRYYLFSCCALCQSKTTRNRYSVLAISLIIA